MKRRCPEKHNILLVNITRLGDMLQASPTISGMRSENKDCKITVLVEKQFESICHWLPDIDEVLTIDLGMTVRSLAQGGDRIIDAYQYVSDLVDDLRDRNFDYCLNMSSSAYTALLLKMVGAENHGGWTSDEEGHRVIESDWAKLFATSVFHQNRQFNSFNIVDVFRCSADVEEHPRKLQINVHEDALEYCENFLNEAGFTNTGPLVCIQAGASQAKRQWAPEKFIRLIKILVNDQNARVVLTGTKKELHIIDPIKAGAESENVVVAAGKTDIPQLAAMLKLSDVLITGDTGPMHICVAAGTPVISMFLASAYGFDTGPYSEGNIVLQPRIVCGPCNPNKACARPDCHDCITPELIAELVARRVKGEVTEVPEDLADPSKVIVYRSVFDQYGFIDLRPLNSGEFDVWRKYRSAYRRMWLEDLAGYGGSGEDSQSSSTAIHIDGLDIVVDCANQGVDLIDQLIKLVRDPAGSAEDLGRVSSELGELDRRIEEIGFHHPPLAPVTRMFVFSKENIAGTDPILLASQMREIYQALKRRTLKLNDCFE
jgi:ADP-heptose:LPS heptosyltransferase